MNRIHFGEADLRRVRFAERPEPMWDTVLAVFALSRDAIVPSAVRGWRARTLPHLHPAMRPMLGLFAPTGLFPDFLTPEAVGLHDGLEALRATPAEQMRRELAPFLPRHCLTGYAGDLLAGDRRAVDQLGIAVRLVHDTLVTPLAGVIERRLAADLAFRSHLLVEGGLDAALTSLHPQVTWNAPVLTTRPINDDTPLNNSYLAGRGLVLYPSVFTAVNMIIDQPGRTPMLVYPAIENDAELEPDRAALAELLGRTRAEVLAALTGGANTSELARRTGISPASASEHARVLRRSGLVTTQRNGQSAIHTVTPLGRRLLAS